jgi:hypothetical protein
MSDATQSYAYLHRSSLADGRLGLETSGGTALAGPAAHPRFFSGFLTEGIPALKPVVERGGSSRLVAEARRLTNVLP